MMWPYHEANNSPQSSAEVYNAQHFTSVPPLCCHGTLLRHDGNFTFYVNISSKICETLDNVI